MGNHRRCSISWRSQTAPFFAVATKPVKPRIKSTPTHNSFESPFFRGSVKSGAWETRSLCNRDSPLAYEGRYRETTRDATRAGPAAQRPRGWLLSACHSSLTARVTRSRSMRSANLCSSLPRFKTSICLHGDPLWNAALAASTALSTSG